MIDIPGCSERTNFKYQELFLNSQIYKLQARAQNSRAVTVGQVSISFPEPATSGRNARLWDIRCRMPGILAKTELRILCQRPIRFLPETDYPRASRSL
jgi:hypothetical protein